MPSTALNQITTCHKTYNICFTRKICISPFPFLVGPFFMFLIAELQVTLPNLLTSKTSSHCQQTNNSLTRFITLYLFFDELFVCQYITLVCPSHYNSPLAMSLTIVAEETSEADSHSNLYIHLPYRLQVFCMTLVVKQSEVKQ